ncbi:hypothetical protein [Chryseobacterium sp. Mn2064]|uniref:hypothetical protein n=1 Tax=Chryseobacterium sp. Mn2064 TaxID=3395263 RepID=UPI003BD1A0C5
MKILYLILPVLFLSCSQTIEQRCFINSNDQKFEGYKESKPYTAQQILNEKPDYLDIVNLKKFRSFKKDSIASHPSRNYEELDKIYKKQETDFKLFREKFSDQFFFHFQQDTGNVLYALGQNRLGFWLLTIENNKHAAYFLGLSFSHYYFNKTQELPMIKDGFLQLEGSLVKIVKVPGLPGYDDYSAMEDGKLFKINLKSLMKDSDQDGYNDIFEKSFGLNPESKDTDGDGINDFDDLNPMFRSEKNKFAQLYEDLLPDFNAEMMKKLRYTFSVYKSDCDYFHQINPQYRVLFIPESTKKQPYYVRMTDVTNRSLSKIQKDDKDPDTVYIYESGSSFTNDYKAKYVKGKWILENIGGTVV